MNATYPKAHAVFVEALKLPPAEWDRFLDDACGDDQPLRQRLDHLLEAHRDAGTLHRPTGDPLATSDQPTACPGTHIGAYKLLEQIGEGGMGIVYVAEQTQPVRRRVALKIIKPGMDTRQVIARFEAERQALAMMDHPNIAKIFDAGSVGDRPYFVMELVRGMPITEYCDKAKQNPRQRLALLVDVCQAVQHAHQKGVIHRDLKPSNILITLNDGTPLVKVIDFGVAKAVGQQLTERTVYTALTQLVGTPLYMSPEQAEMSNLDVDTRSDVYSLGVLLFELLTGTTPFGKDRLKSATFDEMRRIIREEEPETVSNRIARTRLNVPGVGAGVNRRVHAASELDWIVMKALEKDRTRRFESASALAADIQRYLSDEPVLACPPTTMYRFQKFARKHKPALATAAAIAACLILGTTVSAWQAVRATNAEVQANANATDAQEKAKEATEQRDEVKALADRLKRTLYVSNMNLAKHAWDAGGVEPARELLMQHNPKPGETDFRGFEWHYLHRLCQPSELRTIGIGNVTSVAYSPDGKRLATSYFLVHDGKRSSGAVTVWDAETGKELVTVKAHWGDGKGVAFSPDGKRLAGISDDKSVTVWDAQTGGKLLSFKGGDNADGIAFSPDGKYLAAASDQLKVWEAQTGQEHLTLGNPEGYFASVAFSPDSKRLAGVSEESLKVWDVQSGQQLLALDGAAWEPQSVAFSPDGKHLACACEDTRVKVWDAHTGQILHWLNHAGTESVSFSPDGKTLASGSFLHDTLRIWDLQTGQELRTIRGGEGIVVYSPDGRHLASNSSDKGIKIWDASMDQESKALKALNGKDPLAISPDWKRLATAGSENVVNIQNVETGQITLTLKGHTVRINSVAFSSDGKRLASAASVNRAEPSEVKVWDAQTGQELHRLQIPSRGNHRWNVIFSPDGNRLATFVGRGDVKVWDVNSGRELFAFTGSGQSVTFSPDSKRLAGGGGSQIKIWDCDTGQELLSLEGRGVFPHRLAFSPDGKRLASSGTGGAGAKVYDAQTGTELLTIKGHVAGFKALSFSPDGTRLASTSNDQTVKLWNAHTGQELLSLRGGDWPSKVVFSTDGHRLAVHEVGAVRVYDATPLPEKP